jgi:hypothetical protein
MHLERFTTDTMTARRAPIPSSGVCETLFLNLPFLLFSSRLGAKIGYYFRAITPVLLLLGYYPEEITSAS